MSPVPCPPVPLEALNHLFTVQVLFGVCAEHRGVVRGTPHRPNRGLPPWKLKDMLFYIRTSKEKRGVSMLGQTNVFLLRKIVIAIEHTAIFSRKSLCLHTKTTMSLRKFSCLLKNTHILKEYCSVCWKSLFPLRKIKLFAEQIHILLRNLAIFFENRWFC